MPATAWASISCMEKHTSTRRTVDNALVVVVLPRAPRIQACFVKQAKRQLAKTAQRRRSLLLRACPQ